MTLIVEDGSGRIDAESYISVARADAHHAAYGNSAWAGAATTDKEAALRRAARHLDGSYGARLLGTQKTADQALAWPRYGVEAAGDTPLPGNLEQAAAEAALRALEADLAPDRSPETVIDEKRTTVGPLTTAIGFRDTSMRGPEYPLIDQLMAPFLRRRPRNRVVRA